MSIDFVRENQRQRLLSACALLFAEHGYAAVKLSEITKAARVSRRTFYEHFKSKDEAAIALACSASTRAVALLENADFDHGLAALVTEVVAAGVGSELGAGRKAKEADRVLQTLVESIRAVEPEKAAA